MKGEDWVKRLNRKGKRFGVCREGGSSGVSQAPGGTGVTRVRIEHAQALFGKSVARSP